MTRTQWRRYQRKKKAEAEATASSSNFEFPPLTRAQVEKKPMAKRLFPPLPPIKEKEKVYDSTEDTDMLIDNFNSECEDDLHIICNVVSILPAQYDMISKVMEEEDDPTSKEAEGHKCKNKIWFC